MKFRFPSFLPQNLVFFLPLILILLLSTTNTCWAQITLAWDPNSEPDLAGYRIFCRQQGQSYNYNDPVWEGSDTTCTIHGLGDSTTYYFVARAFDTSGNESGDSNEVRYQPSLNAVPTADAGPDQTVDEGTVVTLDGSNSTDPDGSIASYLWTQTTGTSVTLSDPTSATPTFIAPDVGLEGESLTFRLLVTDNGGLQSTDTCTVNVSWGNVTPILTSLSISGPDSVNERGTASYTATATFSEGSSQPATNIANWSEDSSYASISESGVLTTSAVPSDETVTITATYTFGNVTRTAQKTVTIVDVDKYDSDGDGMPDWWEGAYGLNPSADDSGEDPDGDWLSNLAEYENRTNPNATDSDEDGVNDGDEVAAGTDPNHPEDYPVFYIDGLRGDDANSGRNWGNAMKTIRVAIDACESTGGGEVWVIEGTYVPGTARTDTFQLRSGVALYGGFDGTETSQDERDWTAHVTILSGDIGKQGDDSDNSFHVVTGADNAVIDGFTIMGGNADGYFASEAGGMVNNFSSPTVINCTFTRNRGWNGGGMHNYFSSPMVNNCIFNGNSAGQYGGGIYNSSSSPTVTNCTFFENTASVSGGGMENRNSSPMVKNCIFWGDFAPLGPEINVVGSGTPKVEYCLVQGGWPGGTEIINGAPLFVDPDGPDDIPANEDDDFHLQHGSPGIDAGDPVETLTADCTGGVVLHVDSVTGVSAGHTIWITDGVHSESDEVISTTHTTITVANGITNSYRVADGAYLYTESSDFSNEPEPNGGRINIGAYGGTSEATPTGNTPPSPEVIIDNGDAGTSSTWGWYVSGGVNPYGDNSLFSGQEDAGYTFEAALDGSYDVSLWWTEHWSRCSSVPVGIYDGYTLLDTIEVNQKANGGRWNLLGTYVFSGTATIVIISQGSCTTCADAVMFVSSERELDHIEIEGPLSVNENSSADYNCRAYYTNGANQLIEPDTWDVDSPCAEISATGLMRTCEVSSDESCQISASYTEGHTTRTDTYDITIREFVPPGEVIIDNGDAGTSSTWGLYVSIGANPYGDNSLYSMYWGARYTFEAALDGSYEVSLWWTELRSRCSSVPVEIYDGYTLVDTIEVNQKANGGQWNLLGTYVFSGIARVVIISEGGCSTCADAVRFVYSAW